MKVLLLTQFQPPVVGGVERHVRTLASALTARAHDVTVLSFATGPEEPAESDSEGVRIVRVRTAASRLPIYSDPTRPYALPLPDPLVSRAIRHELSRGRFDVVHAHNWIVNSALGPAARAQVPLVMTLHDFSHICAIYRFQEHGAQTCSGPSPARCLSCASSHYGPIRGPITLAANAWSAQRRADRVARFAAVSNAVATAVTLDGNTTRLAGARLNAEVIPNFIPDEIVLDEIPPTGPEAPLLFVGNLSLDKGFQTLLEAYRLLDGPPPLVLAGRSTPGSAWTIPDGVQWLGSLPHDEVLPLFRSARAVIVPSIIGDACPTVVLEAMAAGRPVIASATGGIVDLVVEGVTGLLVPPGDASALAEAISSVLRDPRAAQAFGAAGRNRAREFTVSAVVPRIERLYASAIAETKVKVTGVG